MTSIKPGKQRKELFNAPMHKKRKWLASHLEEKLLLKYDQRSLPIVKGDTVKVMRGSFKGHEDKVSQVNVRRQYVEIEGLTMIKADGKKIAKPIHPSNLLITKLNLTDNWRRQKLERDLSEETKKEIEQEAEAQIKELEVERKRAEEEAQAMEAELAAPEEAIEESATEEPSVEKPPKKEEPPKEPGKKPAKIKAAKKPASTTPKTPAKKPPATKKTTTAKKPTSKKKTGGTK